MKKKEERLSLIVDPELKKKAQLKALLAERTLTDVIVKFLAKWVEKE